MSDKQEYVMVPREAWDFLCGAGPLDGVWFGNPHPKHLGAFWWRSYICAMLQAAPPAPAMHASAPTGMKCADCYMDKEACPTCYSAWWKARHPHSQQMPEGAPPAPVAHSKSEYKRRVAMGDANVLPPAPVAVQPAPVFCEYCGGNDDDPPDHCTDCTRPGNTPVCSSCGGAGCQDCAPDASPSPAPVAELVVTDAQIDEASERKAFEAWASDQGFLMQRTVHGEDYQDLRTQGPWEAWQARAILAAQSGAGTRGEQT